MDHLPQLTGQSSRVANAPFYSRYNYDSVGIQGFPERCGYQLGSPYHHRDADSAFFQAWLYFGTLIEVLGTYDITVEVSDFCKQENDGVLSLCTSSLQDYIAAWVVKASREDRSILEKDGYTSAASALGSDIARMAGTATGRMIVRLMGKCPAPKQTQPLASREQIKATTQNRASRIHEIFREVATMLHDLAPRASSVRESVWDSTLVLCSSLQTAAHFIYRSQNLPFKFSKLFDNIPARQLGSLFDRNGWCVRERKIIRDMAEGDNCVLFLSAQLSRWADVSHNKCNIQMCKAYQVENESIYETKHVVDACKCDMIGFGRSQGGFLSAISTAIIQPSNTPLNLSSSPMIKYKDGNIQLVEMTLLGGDAKRVKLPFGQAFAAVSHVWAHGLGNPHSNDAPRCQVERIQSIFSKQTCYPFLYKLGRRIADHLCQKNLVNELFPNEPKPIPFWLDTLCIPVDEFSRREALKRMEGIYKSATKILVLDRTLTQVSASTMSPEEIGLRIMCSPWARRLWTLSEGSFQSRVVYKFKDSFHYYDHLNKTIQTMCALSNRRRFIPKGHFLNTILDNPPNCLPPVGPLWRYAYKALSCTWPRISTFFKEMNLTYQPADPVWFPGAQLNPWIQITVPRAIRTVMSRTTSKITDEALVFASLTHWWTGAVAQLVEVSKEERYRHYFQRFGAVPTQLIFLNQKRYDEYGSRWIPRSLLSQSCPDCDPVDFEHKMMDDEFGWQNSQGLEAEYPGFALTSGHGGHWGHQQQSSLTQNLPQTFQTRLLGAAYTARVHDPGSKSCRQPLPVLPSGPNANPTLAVILPRRIWTAPRTFTGVLVTICDPNTAPAPPPQPPLSPMRGSAPTSPSSTPPSRSANSRSGTRLSPYGVFRKTVVDYRDRDRLFARHEALIDFSLASDRESGQGHIGPGPLMFVQATAIEGCRSGRDGRNIRWRIG